MKPCLRHPDYILWFMITENKPIWRGRRRKFVNNNLVKFLWIKLIYKSNIKTTLKVLKTIYVWYIYIYIYIYIYDCVHVWLSMQLDKYFYKTLHCVCFAQMWKRHPSLSLSLSLSLCVCVYVCVNTATRAQIYTSWQRISQNLIIYRLKNISHSN